LWPEANGWKVGPWEHFKVSVGLKPKDEASGFMSGYVNKSGWKVVLQLNEMLVHAHLFSWNFVKHSPYIEAFLD
jgi:hypothetical protein